MMRLKRRFYPGLIFLILFALLLLSFVPSRADTDEPIEVAPEKMYRALVLDVENEVASPDHEYLGMGETAQRVVVKILSGPFKGEILETLNHSTGNPVYDISVQNGDEVVVIAVEDGNRLVEVHIADFVRDRHLLYLGLAFVLLLVALGGLKGLKALIALAITLFAVAFVLLPMLLRGFEPIPLTVLLTAIVTAGTFAIIAGFSKKSLVAVIGTTGGVICAGFTALLVGKAAHLTGLSQEEAAMLQYIPQGISFNFKGLLFAGIIIGALGAVMDVAMSITSAVEELKKANPALGRPELFRSGMSIGRDIMGTMSNTLILAYTGASLPLMMLLLAYKTPFIKVLNLDMIATEVVQALAGSLGLIAAIPLTAGMASLLHGSQGRTMSN